MYGWKSIPANLKKTRSPESELKRDDPITITYSKKDRTVHFTSKEFDYYQNNLPQKDFAISMYDRTSDSHLEVKFEKIW